ncbi:MULTISPECIES: TetR/AcrR family transcriptional regulator [Empedobacter]|uniref:TetR/AcrR family transcriptional regulator n=1 Tax=Empedobacter TaxID=59734 RepID=UPI00244C99B2|nr:MULTISPECIES: TetR/AcrR family transcriptional regulator [Empedobacter]MDH1603368.1 TetR/AcrR family transcriptional regulator [Empedobacter sp. GD03739]MDM1040383.1 TetR/AcrR family transcriptional regulator [Empedobacter brevis]MDM1134315.1 TetR/AcrR family transcriptional regulator [Empedobacter sp. R750]
MPKQSKKELIIQEAALIFKQKGYSATSMRELAEKVGMEAASLYNHIRSKDEILEEICFKVANQYVSHISSIEDTNESNVQKLRDLIQLHVRMIIDEPNEVSVANNDWKNLSDTKKELYKTIRKGYEKRIANLIKAGIAAGEFKDLNVSVALFTLLSSLRWIELWYKPGRDISPEQLENDLMTLLINGFQK